jgi:hypothetical protein
MSISYYPTKFHSALTGEILISDAFHIEALKRLPVHMRTFTDPAQAMQVFYEKIKRIHDSVVWVSFYRDFRNRFPTELTKKLFHKSVCLVVYQLAGAQDCHW